MKCAVIFSLVLLSYLSSLHISEQVSTSQRSHTVLSSSNWICKSESFQFNNSVFIFINLKTKIGTIRRSLKCENRCVSTYLSILLLLCGDVEMNPGPNNTCAICDKIVKNRDKALQCDNCEKWSHIKCSNIDNVTYQELAKSDENWFCQNCVSPCGICFDDVSCTDPAIECDSCHLWIHNKCSLTSTEQYQHLMDSNCVWICPNCDSQNLSTSLIGSLNNSSFESENSFNVLNSTSSDNHISTKDRMNVF